MVVTAEFAPSSTRFNVVQIHYGCHDFSLLTFRSLSRKNHNMGCFQATFQNRCFLKLLDGHGWNGDWRLKSWSDEANRHHVYEEHRNTQNFVFLWSFVHECPTYERARVKLWNRVLSLMPPAIFTTFKIWLDFAQMSFLLSRAQFWQLFWKSKNIKLRVEVRKCDEVMKYLA